MHRIAIACVLAVLALSSFAHLSRRQGRPLDYLFPEQQRAILDPATRKCLWTTGRAGKSTAVLTGMVDDGMRNQGCVYWYFCLTAPHVEEIAWPTLRRLNSDFNLGATFQEQKLRMKLPTGSWIRLFGFDRPLALDRFYGVRLKAAAIDEAAFSNIDLDDFCEDTLGPRLVDQGGPIYLMSIPPKVPRGLFDEIIRGFPKRRNMSAVRSPNRPRWSVHSWTALDNPTMRDRILAEIETMKREDPGIINQPYFRRNYLGERVQERGELVYEFIREKNTYLNSDGEPRWIIRPDDRYVLGLDFGWSDSTAFSLNVWRPDSPDFVEMESYKEEQMRMDAIAAHIRMYMDYVGEDRLSIVGDYAHRQFFEELRRRYDLPIKVAEKWAKGDWIEVYGNDLFMGHVKIVDPDASPHVKEMQELTWKVMRSGKRLEQPGAPNDCCDAHLMAYREAYHYLHEEVEKAPTPGTPEWHRREQEKLEEQIEEQDRALTEWSES